MARGKRSEVGATHIAPNGYHYTRTITGWRGTHQIIAEAKLGRPLQRDEIVRFIGSKTDLTPENIVVIKRGQANLRTQLARLEAKIEEMEAQRAKLREALASDA